MRTWGFCESKKAEITGEVGLGLFLPVRRNVEQKEPVNSELDGGNLQEKTIIQNKSESASSSPGVQDLMVLGQCVWSWRRGQFPAKAAWPHSGFQLSTTLIRLFKSGRNGNNMRTVETQ